LSEIRTASTKATILSTYDTPTFTSSRHLFAALLNIPQAPHPRIRIARGNQAAGLEL